MTDALEDHESTVSIGGRTITHLLFADGIDGVAGEQEEMAKLVASRQNLHSLRHGDQCQKDKADNSGINTEIKVNRQKLETVTSFKYLGSVITDDGSKPEILSRIAQTTAAYKPWK